MARPYDEPGLPESTIAEAEPFSEVSREALSELMLGMIAWHNERITQIDQKLQESAAAISEKVAETEHALVEYLSSIQETDHIAPPLLDPAITSREDRLADFRSKLFTGAELGLSTDQILDLQSFVIRLDSELEHFFLETPFGKGIKKISDPQELLNRKEVLAVLSVDKQLKNGGLGIKDHTDHFEIRSGAGSTLLKALETRIKNLMTSSSIAPHESAIIESEKLHLEAVAQLVFDCTDSKLLATIASIHDCFKHRATASRNQLQSEIALHEIGSAILAEEISSTISSALKIKYPSLNDSFCSGLSKIVFKFIAVHGFGEYPHQQSRKNPLYSERNLSYFQQDEQGIYHLNFEDLQNQSQLNRLSRSIYPVPPAPKDAELFDESVSKVLGKPIRNMALALSAADQLVGGYLESFAKYNVAIMNDVLSSYRSVSSYVLEKILVSILSCVENESLTALEPKIADRLQQKVAEIKRKAALLLYITQTSRAVDDGSSVRVRGNTLSHARGLARALDSSHKTFLKEYTSENIENQHVVLEQCRTDFDIAFRDIIEIAGKIDLDQEEQHEPGLKAELNRMWNEIEEFHTAHR